MNPNSILSAKILIVDSNIDYSKYLQMVFIQRNYLTYIASSTEEALNLTHDKIPDCVIIDYNMPSNGAAIFAQKLKEDKLLQNTPVIFLTSLNVKSVYINALENGADDYLPKSVDLDVLFVKIDSLLRHKYTQETNRDYMDKMKLDIQYAARVQKAILNKEYSNPPNSTIVAFQKPASEVSGDYYDIVDFKDGNFAIILADVAGHGVAASMLTILIKSFFDSNANDENANMLSPAEFISKLNMFFLSERFEAGFFSTVFYGIYNDKSGQMIYSMAGCPIPFLYSSEQNKVIHLDAEGPLIGMTDDAEFENKTIKIGSGDIFLTFTDGAYEIFNSYHEILGEEKFEQLFLSLISSDIENIPTDIEKYLLEYSNNNIDDDLTMIAMKRQ